MTPFPPSLRLRRAFADSSSYAALQDRNDTNHEAAVAILGDIAATGYRLVTTNVILIEAHALILSSLGREQARQFLIGVRQSNTALIRVRAQDEVQAQGILFRYTDKDWSFADATSFVIMDRLGIDLAFTFDSDFGQYRKIVLTPGLIRRSSL
jgi:predicted nucleic acid-binding protein